MTSVQVNYDIRCPACAHEQNVKLYDLVLAHREPALREAVLKNQLNRVTCAGCGKSFRVDKPFYYADLTRALIIHLLPLRNGCVKEAVQRHMEDMKTYMHVLLEDTRLPECHLVFTPMELAERIFLVEAGLNPRIVEYIKHQIYLKNAARLEPRRKLLLFDAADSDGNNLCFVVQDTETRALEMAIRYPRKTYAALQEMFAADDRMPELLELFPGPHVSARQLLLADEAGNAAATE